MAKQYILSIDQGTTGSRAFIIDDKGRVVSSAYREFPQYFPKPGWVEHDADEIWASVKGVISQAIRKAGIAGKSLAAIGITNQRETTIMWDRRTSKPVCKAIVWQCRRTAEMCRRLKKHGPQFHQKTGLVLDPYFSGTKIAWMLNNVKGLRQRARAGKICFGTVDSWLIWKLTGGQAHVTDMTNASRTLIFNILDLKWDPALIRVLNIPAKVLPEVKNSGAVFGKTAKGVPGLPAGVPITAVLGDQQAALYGQGCYESGTAKNTYGTGCFLVVNTGNVIIRSRNGLLTTLASDVRGRPVYAMEGAVFIAGAVVQWLRDQLGIIKTAADCEPLIKGLKDNGGVYFVPAFVGLGAPYWDSGAKGVVCGLTRGADKRHIVRAALEAMAYQTKDVFDLMRQELGRAPRSLRVDGGACANDFLMQFQSDMLNTKIIRPRNIDSTALGAAHLAGVTVGVWKGKKDLEKLHRTDKIFSPKITNRQRLDLYGGWLEAVERAKS